MHPVVERIFDCLHGHSPSALRLAPGCERTLRDHIATQLALPDLAVTTPLMDALFQVIGHLEKNGAGEAARQLGRLLNASLPLIATDGGAQAVPDTLARDAKASAGQTTLGGLAPPTGRTR